MRSEERSIRLTAVLAMFAVAALMTGGRAVAQQEKVLHSFSYGGTDGNSPYAGVVLEGGNLYGTTLYGGPFGSGTVFELTYGEGRWTEDLLHQFGNSGTSRGYPFAGLISDASGNLYGTTFSGGANGQGSVFELSLVGGEWVETTLHSFAGGDGNAPYAGLVFDSAGNLYGTASGGGADGVGTVFELSPAAGGVWTEKVLYSFRKGLDGRYPEAPLILDKAGNLYSTTPYGGVNGPGMVFELSPAAGGGWTEKILHNFGVVPMGSDGFNPFGGLVFDHSGNLYGATYYGGTYGFGTIFQLKPTAKGTWTEKVLHDFAPPPGDGVDPYYSLIFDAAADLYGTTSGGGAHGGGIVFKLTPRADGGWTETILYNFDPQSGDGYNPSGLIFDAARNLYGTTSYGGAYGWGAVFEITP